MKFSLSLMVLMSLGLVNSASVKAETEDCKTVLSEKMTSILRVSFPKSTDSQLEPKASLNAPSPAHELANKYKVLMSKVERDQAPAPSAK